MGKAAFCASAGHAARLVPVAPKEALQPIPPAGYFLTRWLEIFKP